MESVDRKVWVSGAKNDISPKILAGLMEGRMNLSDVLKSRPEAQLDRR